jgi:ribosome biogenesis protein BMS1
MIDTAKTADLTLLLIDASFGFEMETMEYLNILSSHGMTRIFGILTHLDLIKKVATVRAVKKRLKHRFWTEIYDGAKLFYLSGVLNGRYPDREILNLSRFISVLKFRPLRWKMSHSYVLADRMEELTPPQDIENDPLCDRTITLYGYLRGTNFSANQPRVHIPGVGDFTVSQVTGLIDPCPAPSAVARERGTEGGKIKRRSLNDKQKLIYAPMSDVGGVMFDKDAVYITVPEKQSFTRREGSEEDDEETGVGERLVMRLQESRNGLGGTEKGLRLFSGSEEITKLPQETINGDTGRKERRRPTGRLDSAALEELDDVDDDDEEDGDDDFDDVPDDDDSDAEDARLPGDSSEDEEEDLAFAESDSDMGEPDSDQDLPSSLRWKENLSEKASALYSGTRRIDLNRLIYGDSSIENIVRTWREYTKVIESEEEEENIEDEDDDNFFKKAVDEGQSLTDGSMPQYSLQRLSEWKNEEKIQSLKNRFVTSDILQEGEDQEAETYGDFEDLEETGETEPVQVENPEEPLNLEAERAANAKRKQELRLRFEEAETNPDNSDSEDNKEETWGDQQKAKIQKQLDINKREFEGLDPESRVKVEGYLPGTYVRMVLHGIPCEFVERFDPRFPIILGGLLNDEQRFGYIQV